MYLLLDLRWRLWCALFDLGLSVPWLRPTYSQLYELDTHRPLNKALTRFRW